MTITIFEKDDFKGKSQTISGDVRDLKGRPADKPGSIKLSDDDEAALLFAMVGFVTTVSFCKFLLRGNVIE